MMKLSQDSALALSLACPVFADKSRCSKSASCQLVDCAPEILSPEMLDVITLGEEKYRALAEHSSEMILIINKQHTIEYINHAPSGHTKEDLIGASVYGLVSSKYRQLIKDSLNKSQNSQQPVNYESDFLNLDGSIDYYETIISPIFCQQSLVAFCLSSKNVTKKKRLQQELTAALADLTSKNIALKEVISVIEEEKNKAKEIIHQNLSTTIGPIISRLKRNKTGLELSLLEMIEEAIEGALELFLGQDRATQKLSNRERQICLMIKKGLLVKEIAQFYHLSERTIDKHRENIRNKLGLQGTRINLASFLMEIKNIQ